ncbi:hypothetical protein FH972_018233 [Carpinus fangiana]|uniref:Plastocyanin-like domain-containing protein n=1 Tax=Carpinus fangiana TaxID=176857 RepID=A0A5N6RPR5_9ROSI|nr:hypothetical protein FH972_018233 [Carpinus fangiana]
MNEEMFFGIAEHTITVVGQDGAYTTPITMDYIMITPGQTMDVLLTANQASGYYYMNATPFADSGAPYDTTNTSDILVTPGQTFGIRDEASEYEYPTVGNKAPMIDYAVEVELVFQGTNIGNAENHPMHLHGYSFYLVGKGPGNWDTDNSTNYNLGDPPLVNTIGVPKNGWAAIRFKADNPVGGLSGVIIVQNGEGSDESILPPPLISPIVRSFRKLVLQPSMLF